MKLLYKWTYEDHLLPSSAENASFSTLRAMPVQSHSYLTTEESH